MKTYQIEFEQDGSWLRAHHDFDGIKPEYDNFDDATTALEAVRDDNPDYTFAIIVR